jgi:hypothetical protein
MAIEPLGLSSGYLSEIARMKLTYDDGASDAPASIIAKLPSQDEVTRALGSSLRLYDREVLFYQEIGDAAGIGVPACYFASMFPTGTRYVLLLEDLGRVSLSSRPSEYSMEQAAVALRALAAMHARWWNSEKLNDYPWLATLTSNSLIITYEGKYRRAWNGVKERLGHRLPQGVVEIGDLLLDRIPAVFRSSARGPETLAHGTFRPENIYFGNSGDPSQVLAASWHFVGRRRGASDVAFFVPYSVPHASSAEQERLLLRPYHEALVDLGVGGYGFDELLEHYRFGLIRNLMLFAIGDDNLELQVSEGKSWSEQRAMSLKALVDWDCQALLRGLK